MDAYFNFMFKLFSYGALIVGAMAMLLAILFALAWVATQIYNSRPYWRVLFYATAVRLHGVAAADRFFWQAVDEKAAASEREAELIIERAKKQLPANA